VPLLVRGEKGTMPPTEAADMRALRPETRVIVVPGAGHDVHLDQPRALYEAIGSFHKTLA
jgi:pimeloyl-ACP methyl ester carboxylesterase